MLCVSMLAISMLLGAETGISPALQQETDAKSGSSSQSQTQSNQTETPSDNQGQPATQKEQSEKSKDKSEQPEDKKPAQPSEETKSSERPQDKTSEQAQEKKSSRCGGQDASAKGKCGERPKNHRRVVRQGSTGEPTAQLAPGMTPDQALRHRQTTEQLLTSTEGNLRQLAQRSLNQNQQDTVSQIRNYMTGARSALQNGDLLRARNLAFKAHLLADDLARH